MDFLNSKFAHFFEFQSPLRLKPFLIARASGLRTRTKISRARFEK